MLFSINYRLVTKQLETLIPYGNAVHQGFAAFIKGFVAFSIIIVFILISKINDLKEGLALLDVPGVSQQLLEKTTWAACYVGIQLSSIVYGMLHFSPLTLKFEGDGESGELTYSIISGFQHSDESIGGDLSYLDFFFSLTNMDLYLKLAMLIPILLLVFAGYSMAKSNQFSFLSLAVLSLVYSLFVAALASFSAISVDGLLDMEGDSQTAINFSLAVSTIRVFIGSFILSYILGLGGSYLTKFFPGTVK
jgi:hypothetical protein